MPYLRDSFLYFIATKRTIINILLGLFLVGMTIYWVAATNNKNLDITSLDSWWNAWGDPVLGLSTFLTAVVIWLSNTAKDWEERLTKKLSVIYKYGDREVIVCKKAYLTNEGDIRNWGQTIGRQTLGESIHFNYEIFELKKEDRIERGDWKYYKHYIATFFLASLPESLKNGRMVWEEGQKQPRFIENNPENTIT